MKKTIQVDVVRNFIIDLDHQKLYNIERKRTIDAQLKLARRLYKSLMKQYNIYRPK